MQLKIIFNNIETEEGNLAEDANVLPNNVGLMFQFEGDKNATKHMFFKVVFARPSVEGETREESIDPNTTTMDITAIPVEKDDHAWVKIDCKKVIQTMLVSLRLRQNYLHQKLVK